MFNPTLNLPGPKELKDEHLKDLPNNLEELNLTGCEHITEKALEVICKIGTLTSLNLSGCTSIQLPEAFKQLGNLSQLRVLRLERCTLPKNFALALGVLQCLEVLDLSRTNIDIEDLGLFPERLEELHLNYCDQIDDLNFHHIVEKTTVKRLFLKGLILTDTIFQQMQKMRHLEHLVLQDTNLDYCQAKDLIREGIPTLYNDWLKALHNETMKEITIENHTLRDEEAKLIEEHRKLESLVLKGCRVTKQHLLQISRCKTLIFLSFEETSLIDPGYNSWVCLNQLKNLRSLNLADSAVNPNNLELANLEEINLQGIKITEHTIHMLERHLKLTSLTLSHVTIPSALSNLTLPNLKRVLLDSTEVEQQMQYTPVASLASLSSFISQAPSEHSRLYTYFGFLRNSSFLEEVDFSFCQELLDKDLKLLKPAKHLKKLSLKQCSEMTDQCIDIIRIFDELEELNLASCIYISNDGVLNIQNPKLRVLNIFGCHAVTVEGVLKLANLGNLEKITVSEKLFNEITSSKALTSEFKALFRIGSDDS